MPRRQTHRATKGSGTKGRRVGFVTSGSYGHHVQKSLALAYVDPTSPIVAELTVFVVGEPRARILP